MKVHDNVNQYIQESLLKVFSDINSSKFSN